MSRHIVATVSEIPEGGRFLARVKGREIVIFNLGGEYHALLNRCPHEGASLMHGTQTGLLESPGAGEYCYSRKGEMLRCPWHGWEFDIRTGKSYCDPRSTWVRHFDVTVEPGQALAEGPFTVEKFDVSVDEDYVVLEL